ncbi:MAG: amidohydrolase, imidazolonepropionase [Planctomycetota bacterium]|nr:amidohydrolase, imidazolonepropionase [Planctomycetota bacterium]
MNHLAPPRRLRVLAMTVVAVITVSTTALISADVELRPDYRPAAYAVVGARIVASSGLTFDPGTVVVRQGVIEAVGKAADVVVPADAETIDGKGLVVYPGFLDLYTTLGVPSGVTRSLTGAGRPIPYADFALPRTPPDHRNGITPEFEVASALELTDTAAEERRKLGFTDVLSAPGGAIASGQSALVSLSGLPRRETIVKSPVGLHVLLANPGGFAFSDGHDCIDESDDTAAFRAAAPTPTDDAIEARRRAMRAMGYPTSLMGVVSHLRQAMLDADYEHSLQEYHAKHGGTRPSYDPALKALHSARTKSFPVYWEANTRDEIHRALDLSAEFGTKPVIVGGREAAKVADRLKAESVPVILRVDFPEEPKVPTEAEYRKREPEGRDLSLKVLADRAAKWKDRVGTAAALKKAGVPFALASDGLAKAETFHTQVRKLIAAGLPAEAAVQSLTETAAEIAGTSEQLGTITKGKLGHLVVLTAPYGDEKSKPRYVFADGMKFDLDKPSPATKKAPEGKPKGEAGAEPPGAEKPEPAKDRAKDKPEPAVVATPEQAPSARVEPAKPKAETTKAVTSDPGPHPSKSDVAKPETQSPAPPKPGDATKAVKTPEDQPTTPFVDVASEFDPDRFPKIKTGGNVLIKDATILTGAKGGTIAKGSILVRDGKIVQIGPDLVAPQGVTVLDATGLVAMPGIIDTHSHMAIQGGVNEMSLSIVPEVRVADVVDGDDPTIYQALAGGTTTARLLHGSANTIGGQDVIIKLRHGLPGRDLILRDDRRPQGVKFALGENVTRSRGRFPNTRMGVEATIERAFLEGKAYAASRKAHDDARSRAEAVPPFRRDLRLEALGGVVDGSIKIHCHCYRSDEILMLLRLCERFGIKVQSLQHVLDGYKIAAEIASHGASASTFSDWWAYKIEAYDAIPHNAALLTEAGVRVCIKSDSEELVRHLYLEAAKMVRYGGVSEAQALEMITLNPARELGIDHRVGSIEIGKDADVALFNAHPFDSYARCQISLVDGEVRFLRKEVDGKFAPRPGPKTMPAPEAEARGRILEIATNSQGLYAIIGATLHPVSGPDVNDGTLVIASGKIAALGGPETPVPAGAQTIDGKGLDVWPGMIDSGSLVGLFEIGSIPETQDFADSAQHQPELRTSVALHPESELIPVTRANGVLSAYIQPTGGAISGQGCLADLNGWVPSEMVVVDGVALNVNIPTYTTPRPEGSRPRGLTPGAPEDPNAKRQEKLEAIRAKFRSALDYSRVVSAAVAGKVPMPPPDPRLAALAPFARGEKPVIFVADRRIEILDALKLASDLKLKAIISGGAEAWKATDELKAAKIPVLLSGTLRIPIDRNDPYDAPYTNPSRLFEAGVPFAIRSVGQGPDQATAARNLPFEAATAVAYGLPEGEAIKAVTLNPATILGIAELLGSLEVGKRANLVITQGPLLQVTSDVKALFIAGKPLTPESRHTRLYSKYRQRLAEVKAGRAPLGLVRTPPSVSPVPAPAASSPAAGAGDGR